MNPSTDLEQRSPARELVEWIRSDETRAQLSLALPEGVPLARFERATATALLANPDLAKADRQSLYFAILSAAQRGLVPDGRQGAIVLYGTKAQFLQMIGGVRDTLAEYGWMLKTAVVYANDEFEIDEAAGTVTHRPRLGDDRGDPIGAYAQAKHRDGQQRMATVMTVEQINEVRDKTGVANNPAWKKWWPQMAEKTVGHRLADDVPLAPQDRRRVEWILSATELEPGESAAALYGPSSANGEAAARADVPSTAEPGGSQQAGDAPTPVASPAPGPDDDFGDEQPDDMAAAQEAAGYVVAIKPENSWVNGLTLAQINAREGAEKFFRWSLGLAEGRSPNNDDELRAHAAAYAKLQLPDLYAELVGEQS